MLENNLHSFSPSFSLRTLCHWHSLSVSFFSHSSSLYQSLYISLSLSVYILFLTQKVPYSFLHSKTAHPTQTSQGFLSCLHRLSLPICFSTPALCSSLHPSFTFFQLFPSSKGFPPYTYIYAAITPVFAFLSCYLLSCILLPLLPCHFPPFFAVILSLGSSSLPAPPAFSLPLLSFVSSPFFQSSCSSLLLHLSSYTFLTLVLDFFGSFLCSPEAWWTVAKAAPPSLVTKSAGRTNIANVICLCVWVCDMWVHPCVHICICSGMCVCVSVGHRCLRSSTL